MWCVLIVRRCIDEILPSNRRLLIPVAIVVLGEITQTVRREFGSDVALWRVKQFVTYHEFFDRGRT